MKNVADALLAARAGGSVIPVADQAAQNLTLSDAYEVQAIVVRKTGAVGGWKVGAAGPVATPVWAPIFSLDIVADGVDLARPPEAKVGIEVEIAFKLHEPLSAESLGKADIQDVFSSAHLVVEYVESRLERPADATDGWKLADNQINGGLVVGEAIGNWQNLNLGKQRVRLSIDGTPTIDEMRHNPGGDPLRLLRWAASRGTGHCGGLRSGQYVTTGSLSGIQWYRGGTRIRAELPDIGAYVRLDL